MTDTDLILCLLTALREADNYGRRHLVTAGYKLRGVIPEYSLSAGDLEATVWHALKAAKEAGY